MSKIKKIILIIVSFFAFIIALCVIVDILDNNNLEVDESIISKKAELLRKNTFCFIDNGANINPLHKSYYINLNYIEDIVPIEYYYPEKYFYEGFWEGARFKNFYEYIFTIDFKNGKSINITNMNYGTNGYIGKLNFREMEFSRLEIVSEKMRNNKIEPIDYSFKIKSSIDKNYTELNFKDIIYFVSEIEYRLHEDELSYLYFYTVKSPYEYKFTFEYKYEAESIINKLKGYKQEELNPYGFVYYRRKPDDYTSMWDFTSEEDFKSKYNVDKYFN
ncbi:hypothetical protein [Brachyspira aalborgi]|uniref:Uncharacterized protein n=1 Tax=Brachyspira aalborgi TaxID=29522 RepID=A0A5C8FXY2_9SPIR|nr:hypothetical protein [Brachyspira aalborgi]TXJ54566.1 hypothetical protein EPJ76_09595 [Brachyspira aalborgi]